MDGKDDKNKDDYGAGLIGQVASPSVETEPRLDRKAAIHGALVMLWEMCVPKTTAADCSLMRPCKRPTCRCSQPLKLADLKDAVRAAIVATEPKAEDYGEDSAVDYEPCELSTEAWARERWANSVRIAQGKTGADLESWLEDVNYWAAIVSALGRLKAVEAAAFHVVMQYNSGTEVSTREAVNELDGLFQSEAETVSPPLSEASRSVPSAAPEIVFCYGADAAIAALKDHSTVLHEGETTPGCRGRSAAPKEPS